MKTYILKRQYFDGITKGEIELISGKILNTIELPYRDNEIGISCIPNDEYLVTRDRHGKHTWFKIPNVNGRSFIEIHVGHKPSHSQGCILLDVVDLQDLLLETRGENFILIIESC